MATTAIMQTTITMAAMAPEAIAITITAAEGILTTTAIPEDFPAEATEAL
jgi:hypothetical protein